MSVVISESRMKRLVNESVNEILYESKKKSSKSGKESKTVKNSKVKGTRGTVIRALKDAKINCAALAYKLWPNKDKANARSQFYKCRDGEPNDNGDAYSFTDAEITRLASILSSSMI